MARAAMLGLLGLLAAQAGAQEVPVELELVLLADASSSIAGDEFDLQIGGYAAAFRDPRVIAAIREIGPGGIAVTFVQWSAPFQQYDVVGWRHLRGAAEAAAFAAEIEAGARRIRSYGTATGSALAHGARRFEDNGFAGRRLVIDISSDEHSNQGPHPSGVRDRVLARGITVNGLAILDDAFDLEDWFRANVTGGPDSFVMAVATYADFAEAIRLKLIREIGGDALTRSRSRWLQPARARP